MDFAQSRSKSGSISVCLSNLELKSYHWQIGLLNPVLYIFLQPNNSSHCQYSEQSKVLFQFYNFQYLQVIPYLTYPPMNLTPMDVIPLWRVTPTNTDVTPTLTCHHNPHRCHPPQLVTPTISHRCHPNSDLSLFAPLSFHARRDDHEVDLCRCFLWPNLVRLSKLKQN